MIIKSIELANFRNYEALDLFFDKGTNILYGDNAQGKTNLLEAIAYLGSGKSFRAQKSAELIQFGADAAQLEGTVFSQERSQTIRWVLFAASRPRQLYRGGAKKKTAGEIAGVLPTVLFCPEDLMILKSGAAARRAKFRLSRLSAIQMRANRRF